MSAPNTSVSTTRPMFSTLWPTIDHDYIVKACSKGYGNYKVPYESPEGSFFFVKRGISNLKAEARTQTHFYHQAQESSGAPRVARVYDIFDDDHGSTYLVMEYIAAPSFEDLVKHATSETEGLRLRATAITEIAGAVTWLLGCPVPGEQRIGPVGGGKVQHLFFGLEEAPIEFASTGALESYVNEALSHLPGRPKPRISLASDILCYSPSDISLKNFLWDGEKVWFVNWQHVNLLPLSFASFYFHSTTDQLIKAVANKINLPRSENLSLIQTAAGSVLQGGNSDYGRPTAYPQPLHFWRTQLFLRETADWKHV